MNHSGLCRIGRDAVCSTLASTESFLGAHAERVTGTPQCRMAARRIAEMLGTICDRVAEEPFAIYPGSLWNIGRILTVAYILAMLLLIRGNGLIFLALPVCLLGLMYGAIHYVFYGKLFDRLFPRAEGRNVVGVIDPMEEVRQQVLVVGHHDSPYLFSFLLHMPKLAGIRMILAIISYMFLAFLSVVAAFVHLSGDHTWSLRGPLLILALVGLAFVIPLFFLIVRRSSPGAGDNLNGSMMAVKVAEFFASRKRGGFPLKNTRLIILSTDGEEAGQRGAIAYTTHHKNDLATTPTSVLNVDSIYNVRDLAVVVRERNGTLRLSADMAVKCRGIAENLGYALKEVTIPLGGGGTDAAAFARAGVRSITIIGMPTGLTSTGLVYHTPQDTVDKIQPQAVEAVLDIVINFIVQKDCAAGDLSD